MRISEIIAALQAAQEQHGDVPVCMVDYDDRVHEVLFVLPHTARKDEYPKDWNMPKGFKFIKLT